MKIKRMAVKAADTTKQEYIVRVKSLLAQHNHEGHKPYIKRATELFAEDPDSESLLPILLSA